MRQNSTTTSPCICARAPRGRVILTGRADALFIIVHIFTQQIDQISSRGTFGLSDTSANMM